MYEDVFVQVMVVFVLIGAITASLFIAFLLTKLGKNN